MLSPARRAFSALIPASSSLLYMSSMCESGAGALPRARCKPIVVCGPSGVGKSTLISMLRQEFKDDFGFSVSHTTRDPRPGEVDGIHYHFVEKPTMEQAIREGKFLEHANVHGNLYGTSFEAIRSVSEGGRVCILDIDVQGVRTCRSLGFDADSYIFVAPPDLTVLETRLRGRGTESEEKIRKRLDAAVSEVEASRTMAWDAYIVNDDLSSAYMRFREATARARGACSDSRVCCETREEMDGTSEPSSPRTMMTPSSAAELERALASASSSAHAVKMITASS